MIEQKFKQQGISLRIEFNEFDITETGKDTYTVPATLHYGYGFRENISLSFTKDFDVFKTHVFFYFRDDKILLKNIKIAVATKRLLNTHL